jgi:hypothetical protein
VRTRMRDFRIVSSSFYVLLDKRSWRKTRHAIIS